MGRTPEQPNIEEHIANPKKAAGFLIKQDLPHIKAGFKGVIAITCLALVVGFSVAWVLVVAAKNATIESLRTANDDLKSRVDFLQKDNDRLVKQNAEFRAALSDRSTPLKEKGRVLVQQLFDFAKEYTPVRMNEFQMEYRDRFQDRVNLTRSALDERGHDSALLDALLGFKRDDKLYPNTGWTDSNYVFRVATELKQLTSNLKE